MHKYKCIITSGLKNVEYRPAPVCICATLSTTCQRRRGFGTPRPAGRSKLLRVLQARLGNPVAYTGSYPLYVGPGQYDVDPTVDPAVVSPINGGERMLQCVLCNVRVHNTDCIS